MKKNLFSIILILLITLASSCVTSSNKNRGSLSDGMDAARDDSKDRSIPDFKDDPADDWQSNDDYWEPDSPENDDYYIESSYSGSSDILTIIRGGSSLASTSYFNSLFGLEVLFGASHGPVEVYVYGGFKFLEVKSSSSLIESIKEDVFMLTGGLEGRYYPLEYITYLSPYFVGKVGGMFFFWDFRNPFYSGNDYISSDILGGVSGGLGIGLDFVRLDNFKLGIQCVPTGYLFGGETVQGFQNDVFNAYGDITLTLEAGFLF